MQPIWRTWHVFISILFGPVSDAVSFDRTAIDLLYQYCILIDKHLSRFDASHNACEDRWHTQTRPVTLVITEAYELLFPYGTFPLTTSNIVSHSNAQIIVKTHMQQTHLQYQTRLQPFLLVHIRSAPFDSYITHMGCIEWRVCLWVTLGLPLLSEAPPTAAERNPAYWRPAASGSRCSAKCHWLRVYYNDHSFSYI